MIRRLLLPELGFLAATCARAPALPPTVARVAEVDGVVFSVAAWSHDSAGLSGAVDHVFAGVQTADRARSRSLFDSLRGGVGLQRGVRPEQDRLARGYALDVALRALEAVSDSAILTYGAQYLLRSPTSAVGRSVGVPDPDNGLQSLAYVRVPPGTWSVSTTQSAADDPILDPRNGKPALAARSVTVVAPLATQASGWATVWFVLGCDSALATAPHLERTGVLCVDSRVRWSPDLDGRVTLSAAAERSRRAGTAPAPAHGTAPVAAAASSGPSRRSRTTGSRP
jgi:hypothetical protein